MQPTYPHSEENTNKLENDIYLLLEGVELLVKNNVRRKTDYSLIANEIDLCYGDIIDGYGFDLAEFDHMVNKTYLNYVMTLDK